MLYVYESRQAGPQMHAIHTCAFQCIDIHTCSFTDGCYQGASLAHCDHLPARSITCLTPRSGVDLRVSANQIHVSANQIQSACSFLESRRCSSSDAQRISKTGRLGRAWTALQPSGETGFALQFKRAEVLADGCGAIYARRARLSAASVLVFHFSTKFGEFSDAVRPNPDLENSNSWYDDKEKGTVTKKNYTGAVRVTQPCESSPDSGQRTLRFAGLLQGRAHATNKRPLPTQ